MRYLSTRLSSIVQTALAIAIAMFTLVGCNDEDDVEMIFAGKQWKITGATINGVSLNSEVKELYANPYYINFTQSTFSASLAEGSSMTGTWQAEGKNKTIRMNIASNNSTDNTVLSRNIYSIIKDARYYSGDANVAKIHKDANNFIILNANILKK